MSHPVSHCPFLNRSDDRCSDVFNLDHLRHAFKFCFDRYRACPVYAELLAERRERRAAGALAMSGMSTSGGGRINDAHSSNNNSTGGSAVVVQITLPPRAATVAHESSAYAHAGHGAT